MKAKCRVVVPMKELDPVIHPLLRTLREANDFDPQSVLVVNDHSSEAAISAAESYGVRLVDRERALDCVDWGRLLPLLNRDSVPKGKGVAVFAGHLYQLALAEKLGPPEWIFSSDAEESGYEEYRALEYLAYGILQQPEAGYVKLAKSGRGNERCLTMRCALDVLAESDFLSPSIRIRSRELYDRTVNQKWMLSGTFGMRWDLAMTRPFATGYLEETLISIFCEDQFARRKKGCTVQIANPHNRGDGFNDERKESAMQQQISNFILLMALSADSTDNWGLQEIERLNHQVLRSVPVSYIQPDKHELRNDPCQAVVVPQDRIIPSVTMLRENGFINMDALRKLV